jgi:soluble lytic murein transglycosylase
MTRFLRNLKHLDVPHFAPTHAVWSVMVLAIVMIAASTFSSEGRVVAPQVLVAAPADPTNLSGQDRSLYIAIFTAQGRGDFSAADGLIAELSNRNLVSHVLAQRYLAANYQPTNEELAQWISANADHPDATRITQIAIRRGMDVHLPKTEKPLKGEGYGEHLGRSTMPDAWFTALSHWRTQNYAAAKPIFQKVSENEDLSDWQRSAAYYWAYRTDLALGHKREAQKNLAHAATYKTTFYGLLAAQKTGALSIAADAPEVSDSLRNDPRAIRAALLAQLDRKDEAEDELRALYSATTQSKRGGIVTLASEMGLPNLQMRLARTKELSENEALFAQYPMPYYVVDLHGVMDSALLLAIARNESGFREVAQSHAGAVGMMQMLPSTARAVERHVGEELLQVASSTGGVDASIAERLSDPALSARYGAEYLKLLARTPAINANLIHLLVGYNAGPGTVVSWKAASRNMSDPLLYIESIPYAETRNYVMQVSAQYWIYQLMMDETPSSLSTLAKGEWPTLPAIGA